MMLLGDVLAVEAPPVEITSLALDDRRAGPGTLFFCVPGFTRDGHDFAPQAIANGGVLREPRLVRRVGGKAVAAPAGRRVISQRTSRALRRMLKGVLAPGGTASEVHIPGYDLAGKTGTANKIDETTGEYSKSKYFASFIGFAPALDPELLIGVVVDEPQGSIYGGQAAAPAFGEIAAFALPYLGIAPSS